MSETFTFPDEKDTPTEVVVKEQDDGIEIQIVDDTPAADKGRKPLAKEVVEPTEEELQNYSEGVKKRIADLTHARHDERRSKEAILREKEEQARLIEAIMAENKQLKQYVNDGSQQYAVAIKDSADAGMEAARRKYKAAQESFDTDAIVAAQEAMIAAQLRAESAKNFRPTTLQVDTPMVQTQQPTQQAVQPDEKTLRWQAKNQWFGDPSFKEHTGFAIGLHNSLVDSGVTPGTDEYFETIDSRVRKAFPDVFGDAPKSGGDSAPRKTASVVAPATRSTGKKVVQLTQTQQQLAKRFGITNQQYAEQVLKLKD